MFEMNTWKGFSPVRFWLSKGPFGRNKNEKSGDFLFGCVTGKLVMREVGPKISVKK